MIDLDWAEQQFRHPSSSAGNHELGLKLVAELRTFRPVRDPPLDPPPPDPLFGGVIDLPPDLAVDPLADDVDDLPPEVKHATHAAHAVVHHKKGGKK